MQDLSRSALLETLKGHGEFLQVEADAIRLSLMQKSIATALQSPEATEVKRFFPTLTD
jgi:hypothetical protein